MTSQVRGVRHTPHLVIFTDLDGTLLDRTTYSWEEAAPALASCKEHQVPLIMVSSKTSAELEVIRRDLSLSYPYISENGGGVFFPPGSFKEIPSGAVQDKYGWKWSLGLPYPNLVKAFREIRKELKWNMKGLSDMEGSEVARRTGLDPETVRLASMREYDEPFVVMDARETDEKALMQAASERGLTVVSGGRFYHLQGKNNKGLAMERLIDWYGKMNGPVFSVALGDSPNDFSMLEKADYPVLVRSEKNFTALKKKIPKLHLTRGTGPKGWNETVLEILKGKEEAIHVA